MVTLPRLRLIRSVLALLSIATCGGTTHSSYAAAGERRLINYDRAGPYILSDKIMFSEDGALIVASIRDFLWRHWQEHRPGFVTTVTFSLEGLPTRTTYFVEQNNKGKWIISADSRVTLPAVKAGSNEHFEKTETSVAYSVERIEPSLQGAASDKRIQSKENLDPTYYRILLRDREGKELERL